MDDDVELRGLRERIYGVDGATATPEMIARLAELEERRRGEPGSPDGGGAHAERTDGEVRAADPRGTEPSDADPPAGDRRPRRVLRGAGIVVAAVLLVGIGVAIGANLTPPAASADPAAAAYPELTFPQTVEDVISADILRDSGIDPASTRYIATVSDFRIYLAQPDDGDGVCIASFTSSDNRPWSVGCATGGAGPSAAFGVDDSLTVAVGQPDAATIDGIPLRLSDSVTAFVAR